MQPWRTVRFLIPPDRDASFVAAMEGILDSYAAPPDPARPLICFDEAGKELQAHTRDPLPGPAVRAGSANVLMRYAPQLGWRHVAVTSQRTAVDWALAVRDLVDVHFPAAERIIVVLDHLNSHRPSSLSTTFPAPAAHRTAVAAPARWTFTVNDARTRLTRLSPFPLCDTST